MNGRKVVLGGALNQPTTITGDATNNLTLNTPTKVGSTLGVTGATTLTGDLTSNGTTALKNTNVTGDLTVSGTTKTATSTVTGNETVGGTLAVTGATTLNATTINDGKASKAGLYLKAMDNTGRAEWQPLGTVATSSPVKFTTGVTIDLKTFTNPIDANTSIVLPPGKWMVQCVLLFGNTSFGAATQTDYSWVQVRMFSKTSGVTAKFSGASMVSGWISGYMRYSMLQGYFIVLNDTGGTVNYGFNIYLNNYTTISKSVKFDAFQAGNAENAIVAFSLTE